MNKFYKIFIFSLIFDFSLLIIGLSMGKWYIVTTIYSLLLNTITVVNNKIRPKKMGFVSLKFKDDKISNILFYVSSFFPIFNVLFSVISYQRSICTSDYEFIKKYPGKLVTPNDAIRLYEQDTKKESFLSESVLNDKRVSDLEYETVSKSKYETAIKMNSIDAYIDYVLLNKNLSKRQKEKILKQFRNSIVYSNKVNLNKITIKKLIKCK